MVVVFGCLRVRARSSSSVCRDAFALEQRVASVVVEFLPCPAVLMYDCCGTPRCCRQRSMLFFVFRGSRWCRFCFFFSRKGGILESYMASCITTGLDSLPRHLFAYVRYGSSVERTGLTNWLTIDQLKH